MSTEIMTVEEITEGLKDKRLYVVADATGLSYPTLKKLADGVNANYTLDTLKHVTDYLRGNLSE